MGELDITRNKKRKFIVFATIKTCHYSTKFGVRYSKFASRIHLQTTTADSPETVKFYGIITRQQRFTSSSQGIEKIVFNICAFEVCNPTPENMHGGKAQALAESELRARM
jgi:hypothetical protein